MSDDFKVYCTENEEHFISRDAVRTYDFTASLLDFLYLDLSSHTEHIYFDMFGLEAKAERMTLLQKKLETLFSNVFDVLPEGKHMPEKLAKYAAAHDASDRFSFSVISTGYEQVERGAFTEILYPNSVEEIVEFFVREILRRELRFRRCKSCGKYFALTGYSNTEYCDRLFGDSGKTCKEAGAVRLYRTKITANPVVRAYNKEYKKRFAWIKYKKITKEAFYEWSERARAERDKCFAKREEANDGDAKLRALEELEQWLKDS